MMTPNSVTIAVGTTATSTANRVLAANSAVTRWIRGVYVTNTSAASIDLSVGVGAAATLSASNADIASAAPIPAKATNYPIGQFVGQGLKKVGAGSANEIMAFASATGLFLHVVYSDESVTA